MFNLDSKELENEDDVRIHLVCKNVFLSLSLGFYLKGHLSDIDKADFIITDIPHLEKKYTNLPICTIGKDLHIPCSVYEMFAKLHEFYSRVSGEKQASIFQSNMQANQNNQKNLAANKLSISNQSIESARQELYADNEIDTKHDLVESIKQKKMQELMKGKNPELNRQIEILFDEFSKKIHEAIKTQDKAK